MVHVEPLMEHVSVRLVLWDPYVPRHVPKDSTVKIVYNHANVHQTKTINVMRSRDAFVKLVLHFLFYDLFISI